MRNVPAGAGRRKNKNSSATVSHYRHIMFSEGLQGATLNAPNGLHNAVMTFGPDSPLCDTMASMLNIAERAQSCVPNGFHVTEPNSFVSYRKEEEEEDGTSGHSTGVNSVATTSTLSHSGSHESLDKKVVEGFTPQFPYFPSAPWPYPIPPPTFFPQGYPLSLYTTPAYWSYMPPSWNNNISAISPQSSVNNSVSNPTLGKHSRDGNIIASSNSQREMHDMEHNSSEHNALIPKTLRIDDPREAAKSSISMWSKLGIKNDDKASSGGLFKAFPSSKGNDINHQMVEASSPVLQANPAALSRSLTFREQT